MGTSVIGALRVTLGIDTAAFTNGLSDAQRKMEAAGTKLKDIGGKVALAGAGMTATITAPFTALVKAAIPAAVESQQALAQVEAALKSMGNASGRNVEQLQEQAGALQSLSNFDDDDILKSVTANLLTFGNISGKVFDDAQLAIVNISARMGTDLQGAALMVGKALNDPVKGIKSLTRVGIQFTDQEKEQIKAMAEAGNTAGAQAIMLGELQKQFGGAAKAQRDATPDAAMQEQWRTFQENIGAVAIKVMPPFLNALTSITEAFNNLSPGTQTFIVGAVGIAAVLGPVITAVGGLIAILGAVMPILTPLVAGIAGFSAIEGTAAVTTVALAGVLGTLLLPLAAVAGAVALVVAAVNHWDEIKAVTSRVVTYMGNLYSGVKGWLVDKLGAVFDTVNQKVKTVGDFFYNLWDRVVGHSYVPDMVDEIGVQMARLDGNMVGVAGKATAKTAETFEALAARVSPLLDKLFPDQAKFNEYQKNLADLQALAKQGGLSPDQLDEASTRLRRSYSGQDVNGIAGPITAPDYSPITVGTDKLISEMDPRFAKLKAANDNVVESYAKMARDVAGSLQGLVSNIKSGDWLGALSSVLDIVSQVSGIIKGTSTPAVRTYNVGSSSTPGFATGGSFQVKGMRGVDANMLSLNGQPIARVSHGETVGVGRGGGPSVVQLVVGEGQMFEPRVASISGGVSIQTVRSSNQVAASRQRQSLA